MTILPQVSGKKVVKTLQKCGFYIKRQKGSHVIMCHRTDLTRRTIVPVHGAKSIKPGTLVSILKGTQITLEKFKELL